MIIDILICFVLPSVLLMIVAIYGTINRLRSARQIFRGIKEGRFDNFATGYRSRRIRFYSAIGLISIVGTITAFFLVIKQYLTSTIFILLILILFLITGSIAGILLSKEVFDK